MTETKWARVEFEMEIHVIPQKGRQHDTNDCWCHPTEKSSKGKKLYSHNEDVWEGAVIQ